MKPELTRTESFKDLAIEMLCQTTMSVEEVSKVSAILIPYLKYIYLIPKEDPVL